MTNTKTCNHGLPWEYEHGIAQGCCVNGTLYISGQFSHDMQDTFVGESNIKLTRKNEPLPYFLTGSSSFYASVI